MPPGLYRREHIPDDCGHYFPATEPVPVVGRDGRIASSQQFSFQELSGDREMWPPGGQESRSNWALDSLSASSRDHLQLTG
jgi:hypothetical protein